MFCLVPFVSLSYGNIQQVQKGDISPEGSGSEVVSEMSP